MKFKHYVRKISNGITVRKKCGQDDKPTLSRNMLIIFITAATIVVVGLISVLVYALTGNDLEIKVINEEENEYMAVNVPSRYEFDITLNKDNKAADIKVEDIYGEYVKAEVDKTGRELRIKAPKGGYTEGEIYYLDLKGKGKFNEEEFSKVQKLMFVIEKKNTETVVYRDETKEVKADDIRVEGENIGLKGQYENGDIIVTDIDKDGFIEAYKLKNVRVEGNMTSASYTEPTADELYKEFDIFYYDNVDFSDAEIDEDTLESTLEKAGILDVFVDGVYAEGKANIEAKIEKTGKRKFVLTAVVNDVKDNNNKLTVTLGLENKLLMKINKKTVYIDDTFMLTNGIEFSVSGEDSKIIEEKIKNAIDEYTKSKEGEGDRSEYEAPLITIPIPVSAFVPTTLELKLTAEILFSVDFNAGMDSEVIINQGIVYDIKKLKTQKKYAEAIGNIDAYIMTQGDLYAFTGPSAKLEANALYLVKATAKIQGGGYLDAEGCFTIEGIPNNAKSMGYYDAELGVLFAANADFEIPFIGDKSIPIAEKRKPLIELSNSTKLKSTDMKDNYLIRDGRLELGTITATYYDISEGKELEKKIESYSLYIDGNQVEVSEGVVQRELKEGSYKFKLQWKEDGNSYTESKNVRVTSFDPWGFFLKNHDVMQSSYADIESKYGKLYKRNADDMDYDIWQDRTHIADLAYMATEGERAYYYTEAGILFYFKGTEMECIGISGTAEQIFGITEATNIETLEQVMTEGKRFLVGYTQYVLYRSWSANKDTKYGMCGIDFYSEGLQNIYDKLSPFSTEWPEDGIITLDNISKYYSGMKKDYKIVYPTTKVSVCLY